VCVISTSYLFLTCFKWLVRVLKLLTLSIILHEKCGFRELGIREKVAKMGNSMMCVLWNVEAR